MARTAEQVCSHPIKLLALVHETDEVDKPYHPYRPATGTISLYCPDCRSYIGATNVGSTKYTSPYWLQHDPEPVAVTNDASQGGAR